MSEGETADDSLRRSMSAPMAGRPWCLFTTAGERNATRLWLEGQESRWDLVVGYYGDDDEVFSRLASASSHAFRAKGGKWQILKGLLARNPQFFDGYSYVWVCDDDIIMSAAQINEAFAISDRLGFWIAQPAFSPRGKISHAINKYPGLDADYRAVNFIEENTPIFRRDKLIQFMAAYDGSTTGYGNDWWYMNFFKAHELGHFRNFFQANDLGRFAIIDRIQVVNPHDEEKGAREIDRIKPESERIAEWRGAMARHGLVEFPHKTFASCKMASRNSPEMSVTTVDVARRIAGSAVRKLAWKYNKLFADWRDESRP